MKYLYLFFLFFLVVSSKSQAQFLLERKNIAEVIKYEAEQHSENKGFKKMKVSNDFFHGALENVDYYPLVIKWSNDTFHPQCEVEYYYSSKDSVINAIVYDWNIMNEVSNLKTDGYKLEQQIGRKDEYIQQYNTVRDQMIKLLGQPSKTQEVKEESRGFFGKTEWNLPDKDVTLTVSFTPQLQSVGQFKFGTFRVRLKTDWK
jgi:hypothetical protein